MQFKQITIIGVGLIGGSIGLAVKRQHLAEKIIGVTAHEATINQALKRKAIDIGSLDVKKAVMGSDMVIIATPVSRVLDTLKNIRPFIKKGSLIIDVASVKESIVKNAEKIIGNKGFFVGAHPMAGSEQKGVEKAVTDLFKGAACIVTKTSATDRRALKATINFWKKLGSRVYELTPRDHDMKISDISHLPHIAACALSLIPRDSSMRFASTGFKDTTRIASGDPDLWVSILLSNSNNVSRNLKDYVKKLENIRGVIARKDGGRLRESLLKAKIRRDRLNTQ